MLVQNFIQLSAEAHELSATMLKTILSLCNPKNKTSVEKIGNNKFDKLET